MEEHQRHFKLVQQHHWKRAALVYYIRHCKFLSLNLIQTTRGRSQIRRSIHRYFSPGERNNMACKAISPIQQQHRMD